MKNAPQETTALITDTQGEANCTLLSICIGIYFQGCGCFALPNGKIMAIEACYAGATVLIHVGFQQPQ